jgi:hypothetical protein
MAVRNYTQEATEMVAKLTRSELHNLYEIALDQVNKTNKDIRLNEIRAVIKAIEKHPLSEKSTLVRLRNGYGEMAEATSYGDIIANNNPKKKKS